MIDSNASLNRISLILTKLKLTNILWQPRCQSPRLVFVKGSKGRYESSTSVSLESYFKDLYGAQKAKQNKTKQIYNYTYTYIYIYIHKNQEIYISFTFSHVHEIYRELYMGARRYGISLRVFNSTSHSFAALTREMSSLTREEKSPYLHATMCYFVYHINIIALYWEEKLASLMNENNESTIPE